MIPSDQPFFLLRSEILVLVLADLLTLDLGCYYYPIASSCWNRPGTVWTGASRTGGGGWYTLLGLDATSCCTSSSAILLAAGPADITSTSDADVTLGALARGGKYLGKLPWGIHDPPNELPAKTGGDIPGPVCGNILGCV